MIPIVRCEPLPAWLASLRPKLPFEKLYVAGDFHADFVPGERRIAVVGSRAATPEAAAFARDLGAAIARAGSVVVSGGARGIDAAAHRGALEAGGRTWAFLAGGFNCPAPPENAPLFDAILARGGALVSPYAPDEAARTHQFLLRNRVLVGFADAVVIVQAAEPSGTQGAAREARKQSRELWVVTPAPWFGVEYDGSRAQLAAGARPLSSLTAFLEAVGLAPPPDATHVGSSLGAGGQQSLALTIRPHPNHGAAGTLRPLTRAESIVAAALSYDPKHLDSVIAQAGLPTAEVATALLTLALEDVVVEGPAGFFRRASRT